MNPMPRKTFIIGKDASLEDTISRTAALIEASGFQVHLDSWLNPAPNCWSVHMLSNECPWISSNGKGSSKKACLASAQAEFLERLSTDFFFSDFYLGEKTASSDFVFSPDEKWFPVADDDRIPLSHPDGTELLTESLLKFYNPDNELTSDLLHDINSENTNRGICALPFKALDTGESVFFPVNILHNLYASNGMSAGNTPDESRSQALGEILERYVKNIIISKGICLPDVPRKILAGYPAIMKALDALRKQGLYVSVKDASLGGKFPVISMLLLNPEDGGCYAAFGASCRFEVALERTVTELLQGRNINRLAGFQPPSHDIEPVADELNLESHFINSDGLLAWSMFRDKPEYSFSPWDFSGSTKEEFQHLNDIIKAEGFQPYCAEYLHCGMYTCRIIVPGMSEIYPVSDLVWNNPITGASLRTHLLNLPKMSVKELREFYTILEDLQFNEDQLISDAIGVLFSEETAWHTLRIGELKALITLAAGHPEEAYTWCGWSINFGHLTPERSDLLKIIFNLISFKMKAENPEDYRAALEKLYSAEAVNRAELTLAGKITFPGLNFASTWEEISPLHTTLIESYQRLVKIKLNPIKQL